MSTSQPARNGHGHGHGHGAPQPEPEPKKSPNRVAAALAAIATTALAEAGAHGALVLLESEDPDGFMVMMNPVKRRLFQEKGAAYETALRKLAPAVVQLLREREAAATAAAPSSSSSSPSAASPGLPRQQQVDRAVDAIVKRAAALPKSGDAGDAAMAARDGFAQALLSYLKPRPRTGQDALEARTQQEDLFVRLARFVGDGAITVDQLAGALEGTKSLKPGGRAVEFRARISPLMAAANKATAAPTIDVENQAQAILRMVGTAELFHSDDGRAFVRFRVGDHWETHELTSRPARRWLLNAFYKEQKKPPAPEAVAGALSVLDAHALLEGPERKIWVRTAEDRQASCLHDRQRILIDLGDPEWRAVVIEPGRWQVATEPTERFRRPAGLGALPVPRMPGRGERLAELLGGFVNADPAEAPLWIAWLTASLLPWGPYPILVVSGEQASAKSTLARCFRRLIDPHVSLLRSEPKELRDLMISACNGWLCAFDNLSSISVVMSDALCRLSTGGGFATRQLFTNDEEVFFEAQRPILLTTIDEVVTRSDMLDRCVFLRVPPIPPEKRRAEQEFWHAFDGALPLLFGAVVEAIALGLQALPDVVIPRPPRFADFARWGEAVCQRQGFAAGAFLAAYDGNRQVAHAALLESHAWITTLQAQAATGAWTGTIQQLLDRLASELPAHRLPANSHMLGRHLRRLAPALRDAGLDVRFGLGRHGREIAISVSGSTSEVRGKGAAS